MKIRDLVESNTLDAYIDRLKQSGAARMGSGNYSVVFTNPQDPETVLKIMHTYDPTYLAYIKRFAMNHPDNPWLPKVFDIQSLTFDQGRQKDGMSVWVFTLERLQRATPEAVKKAVAYVLSTVDSQYLNVDARDYDEFYDIPQPVWKILAQHSKDANVRVLAKFLSGFPPGGLDLRNPNMMMRGSQIVFADPVLP
jgi:hypothetical protein